MRWSPSKSRAEGHGCGPAGSRDAAVADHQRAGRTSPEGQDGVGQDGLGHAASGCGSTFEQSWATGLAQIGIVEDGDDGAAGRLGLAHQIVDDGAIAGPGWPWVRPQQHRVAGAKPRARFTRCCSPPEKVAGAAVPPFGQVEPVEQGGGAGQALPGRRAAGDHRSATMSRVATRG